MADAVTHRNATPDSWDSVMTGKTAVKDLPEELLIAVLQHTDFVARRRLRRVCRQWKALLWLPDLSQTVYLSAHDLLHNGHLLLELTRPYPATGSFRDDTVRQVIFNGQFRQYVNFHRHFPELVYQFAKRCSGLVSLNIRNVRLGWYFCVPIPEPWAPPDRSGYTGPCRFCQCDYVFEITHLGDGSPDSGVVVPLTCRLPDFERPSSETLTETCDRLTDEILAANRPQHVAWFLACVRQMAADARWLAYQTLTIPGYFPIWTIDEAFRLFHDGGLLHMTSEELDDVLEDDALAMCSAYLLARSDVSLPPRGWRFCFETPDFYRIIRRFS